MNITEDNVLTLIIVLLVLVIIYLYSQPGELDYIEDTLLDDKDDNKVGGEYVDPYDVLVGQKQEVTRCKPLTPLKKVDQGGFGFKSMWTPNSRGNVCDKEDIEAAAVFPSLSEEEASNSLVQPAIDYNINDGPFDPNCSFAGTQCNNNVSTFFPGELLMQEKTEEESNDSKVTVSPVESFVNYYEGFIEHNENKQEPKVKAMLFYTDWCSHCTEFKKKGGDWETIKAHPEVKDKVNFVEVDCDKKKELAAEYGVTSFPTLFFVKDGKKMEHKGARDPESLLDKIKELFD